MIEVNRKEVERYLGFKGVTEIDETISRTIDECIEEMNAEINPNISV